MNNIRHLPTDISLICLKAMQNLEVVEYSLEVLAGLSLDYFSEYFEHLESRLLNGGKLRLLIS